jgi:hypothetical protein
MTPEEIRARLRQRTQESAADRGKRGLGRGLRIPFDLSKTNKEVVWYELKDDPRQLNLIDIIPFVVTRPEYTHMRQFSGKPTGRMIGDWDYKLEISVHKKIGVEQAPVLCLREMFGHQCVICEDMFEEYKKRGTPGFNQKTAQALQPQWRCVYVVYDYCDDKHTGFKLWDYASKSFEEYIVKKAENDPSGLVVFADPFDGRTIEIEGEINEKFNKFIDVKSARFLPRLDPYSEDDINTNFPLDQMLIIPSVEEVTRMHLRMDGDFCGEMELEVEQEPVNRSRRRGMASEVPPQNICIAGGRIGHDQFRFPQCDNGCEDSVFDKCSELAKTLKNDPLSPGVDLPSMKKDPVPEPTAPVETAQRRRPMPSDAPAASGALAASDTLTRRRR